MVVGAAVGIQEKRHTQREREKVSSTNVSVRPALLTHGNTDGAISRWRCAAVEFLAVSGISLPVLIALTFRTNLVTYNNPAFNQPFDHHKYILMASSNPFAFHIAPYCWRVLTPLIAKVLPFGLEWNFFLIAFVSIWMTSVTTYYLARRYDLSRICAILGTLTFLSMGFVTKSLLQWFWYVDPLSLLFITLAIWSIVARKDALFVLLLALGVADREEVLLVAPLYYSLNAQRIIDVDLIKRTVLLALPAVGVFVGFRLLIRPLNHDAAYLRSLPSVDRVVWSVHGHRHTSFNYQQIIGASLANPAYALVRFLPHIWYSLRSALILLPFFAFFRRFDLLLRFAPFIALVFAQLLFIADNRYLIGAFPVLVVLAVFGMREFVDRLGIPAPYLLGLPLLFVGLNLVWVDRVDPPVVLQIAILVSYLAVLAWISRRPVSRTSKAAQT